MNPWLLELLSLQLLTKMGDRTIYWTRNVYYIFRLSERDKVAQINRLYDALHLNSWMWWCQNNLVPNSATATTTFYTTTWWCHNKLGPQKCMWSQCQWSRAMSQAKKEEGITWGPHCLGLREKKRKLVMGTEECVRMKDGCDSWIHK